MLGYAGIHHESKIKEKPFYVTTRVKKEVVQALSLRSKVHITMFFLYVPFMLNSRFCQYVFLRIFPFRAILNQYRLCC